MADPARHAKPKLSNTLNIASWNINRGLLKKYSQIEHFLHKEELDVLAIQEADLKDYNDKYPIVFDGYNTLSNLTHSERKTRLIVIVKENLDVTVRRDLMSSDFCSVWFEVKGQKKWIIGAFYREWNDGSNDKSLSKQKENLSVFINQLCRARDSKCAAICLGDMNLDWNKISESSYKLKDLMKNLELSLAENGLTNVDLGNTYCASRINDDGSVIQSALDHIYISNEEFMHDVRKVENYMSDHLPIRVSLAFAKKNQSCESVRRRSFKNLDPGEFCQDLALYPWEDIGKTEDVDEMVAIFKQGITFTLDKHAPFKTFRIKKKKKRIELSSQCMELIKKRDELAELRKDPRNSEAAESFRKFRNKVTAMVRAEKKRKVQDQIESDPSVKNVWNITNRILKGERTCRKLILEEDGQEITEDLDVAEKFNNFFCQKIIRLKQNINPKYKVDPFPYTRRLVQNKNSLSFSLKTVSTNEVLKTIKRMKAKTSHGFDGISSKILKMAAPIIYIPLSHIINTSIVNGMFPESWKLAIVKPLLKKGSKKDKSNYRPVSLLSVPSMVLEKIIKKQMETFLETNKLLAPNQHGFRAHRSTSSALIAMHSQWVENAKKNKSNGILMYDLSAAFDVVDPEILCKKLKIFGFDTNSVKWIKSYLSNRRQQVMIGSTLSSPIELGAGSPQGSCLSPLLFSILVSDIEEWVDKSTLCSFADDTSHTAEGEDDEVIEILQQDAEKVCQFMSSNNLVMNPSKTCFIFNSSKCKNKQVSVLVGGQQIQSEPKGKLLGMEITSNLDWKEHVNSLSKVINQRISLIRRLQEVMNSDSLKTVGEALVNSKFRYGISLYANIRVHNTDPKNSMMEALQRQQNVMMRLILKKKRNDHISVQYMLKALGYLSLNQMATYHILSETHSILNQKTIESLEKLLVQEEISGYPTRFRKNKKLRPPVAYGGKSFIEKATLLWNSIPDSMRVVPSKHSFARNVKTWVINNIPI